MRRKRVEFEGHRVVKKETDVGFTTRAGKHVDFTAMKPKKEEVTVSFLAKRKPKK